MRRGRRDRTVLATTIPLTSMWDAVGELVTVGGVTATIVAVPGDGTIVLDRAVPVPR